MDIKERSDHFRKSVERHPWEVARLDVVDRLTNEFAPGVCNGGGIVLDIGCGDGFITQELARRYPRARFVGIDRGLDPATVKRIRSESAISNLEIYQSLDHIQCGKQCVDIVLLLDVLEHVENDVLFLNHIICDRLVKENAVFVITVPAFQCLFSSRDVFLNHFRRYNRIKLLRVIREAQMNPIQCGYFFSCLLVPRLLQGILEKVHIIRPKPRTSLSKWKGYGFWDVLLKKILIYDFTISRFVLEHDFVLPGLSCYLIGRK